ncbi:MAG: hypothetical protein INF43_05785 [Alphaproteobacteria bacterium]|nr:hypothetical protein [Alphaproteobacteria bacterium]
MTQVTALPNSPVVVELQRRLAERLADLKGDFSRPFAPPAPAATQPPYDALLLPGTLSLAASPTAVLAAHLPQLRPEGVVLGYVLGEASLPELRTACAAAGFAPPPALPAVQDVGSLLQRARLALPVVDREFLTLTFPNPARLLEFLHAHHALQRPPGSGLITPRRWQRVQAAFPVRADGKIPLTLEVIFFHAVQPSAQTPQAAARGSGKISLVKIFSSEENSTACQNKKSS